MTHQRIVNPVSRLTRVPRLDGTTERLKGRFSDPDRRVTPAPIASAKPAALRFGPTPNSVPFLVRSPTIQLRLGRNVPCSSPPTSTTHSLTAVGPVSPTLN